MRSDDSPSPIGGRPPHDDRAGRLACGSARTAVMAAGSAQAAQAHVDIEPAEAAPGDAVEFELIVPGERDAHTIEVDLRIPEGVSPFSFERQAGWHRQTEKAADGSVRVVRWHGEWPRRLRALRVPRVGPRTRG